MNFDAACVVLSTPTSSGAEVRAAEALLLQIKDSSDCLPMTVSALSNAADSRVVFHIATLMRHGMYRDAGRLSREQLDMLFNQIATMLVSREDFPKPTRMALIAVLATGVRQGLLSGEIVDGSLLSSLLAMGTAHASVLALELADATVKEVAQLPWLSTDLLWSDYVARRDRFEEGPLRNYFVMGLQALQSGGVLTGPASTLICSVLSWSFGGMDGELLRPGEKWRDLLLGDATQPLLVLLSTAGIRHGHDNALMAISKLASLSGKVFTGEMRVEYLSKLIPLLSTIIPAVSNDNNAFGNNIERLVSVCHICARLATTFPAVLLEQATGWAEFVSALGGFTVKIFRWGVANAGDDDGQFVDMGRMLIDCWNSLMFHAQSQSGYRAVSLGLMTAYMDAKLESALKALNMDREVDEEEEEIRDAADDLVAAATLARSALPDIARMITAKLQEALAALMSLAQNPTADQTQIPRVFEVMDWLIRFGTHLIADNIDTGEVPMLPRVVVETSWASENNDRLAVPGLIECMFSIITAEEQCFNLNPTFFSPVVSEALLFFLSRFASVYLYPDASLYSAPIDEEAIIGGSSSPDISIVGAGMSGGGGGGGGGAARKTAYTLGPTLKKYSTPVLLRSLLNKIHLNLFAFHHHSASLCSSTVKVLYLLSKRKDLKWILIEEESWWKIFKSHILALASLNDPASGIWNLMPGTALEGGSMRLLGNQNGTSPGLSATTIPLLPEKASRMLFQSLFVCTGSIPQRPISMQQQQQSGAPLTGKQQNSVEVLLYDLSYQFMSFIKNGEKEMRSEKFVSRFVVYLESIRGCFLTPSLNAALDQAAAAAAPGGMGAGGGASGGNVFSIYTHLYLFFHTLVDTMPTIFNIYFHQDSRVKKLVLKWARDLLRHVVIHRDTHHEDQQSSHIGHGLQPQRPERHAGIRYTDSPVLVQLLQQIAGNPASKAGAALASVLATPGQALLFPNRLIYETVQSLFEVAFAAMSAADGGASAAGSVWKPVVDPVQRAAKIKELKLCLEILTCAINNNVHDNHVQPGSASLLPRVDQHDDDAGLVIKIVCTGLQYLVREHIEYYLVEGKAQKEFHAPKKHGANRLLAQHEGAQTLLAQQREQQQLLQAQHQHQQQSHDALSQLVFNPDVSKAFYDMMYAWVREFSTLLIASQTENAIMQAVQLGLPSVVSNVPLNPVFPLGLLQVLYDHMYLGLLLPQSFNDIQGFILESFYILLHELIYGRLRVNQPHQPLLYHPLQVVGQDLQQMAVPQGTFSPLLSAVYTAFEGGNTSVAMPKDVFLYFFRLLMRKTLKNDIHKDNHQTLADCVLALYIYFLQVYYTASAATNASALDIFMDVVMNEIYEKNKHLAHITARLNISLQNLFAGFETLSEAQARGSLATHVRGLSGLYPPPDTPPASVNGGSGEAVVRLNLERESRRIFRIRMASFFNEISAISNEIIT